MGILVLVVDDHAETRREVRALIQAESDLDVVGEAASGAEALRLVEELQPDVTLMDLMMPGLGGIETTRRIRSRFPRVRVVALSMLDVPVLRDAVLASGASRFISKLVAEEDLVTAIRDCVSEPLPAS